MPRAPAPFLPEAFYARDALTVARELLGQLLVLEDSAAPGARHKVGRIVETEAYVGEHDLACHASKGRTPRTEVLFGRPGRAYVYLIYGMYHCFNAVTGPEGYAAAVLVRALEPLEGFPEGARTDGPGRLCRAMGLSLAHNRLGLLGPPLYVRGAPPVPEPQVARGPRIGVDYAGAWAEEPLRLWIRNSVHVSKAGARRGPKTR